MVAMPNTTADVLDLIDAAIADPVLGMGAVRYNAPADASMETSGFPVVSQAMVEIVARFETQFRALMVPAVNQLAETVTANYAALKRFAAAFGLPPCSVGVKPCFCHQAPFPAAQDYRRRTKHRNRRRR